MISGSVDRGERIVRIMQISKEYQQKNRLPSLNDPVLGGKLSQYVSKVLEEWVEKGSLAAPQKKKSPEVINLAIEAGIYMGIARPSKDSHPRDIEHFDRVYLPLIQDLYEKRIPKLQSDAQENSGLLDEIKIIAEKIFLYARGIGLVLPLPIDKTIQIGVQETIVEKSSDEIVEAIFALELGPAKPLDPQKQKNGEIGRCFSIDSIDSEPTDVESANVSGRPSPLKRDRSASSESFRNSTPTSEVDDQTRPPILSSLFKSLTVQNTAPSPIERDQEKKRITWFDVPKPVKSLLSIAIENPMTELPLKAPTCSSEPSVFIKEKEILESSISSMNFEDPSVDFPKDDLIKWVMKTATTYQKKNILPPFSEVVFSRFTKLPKEVLYVVQVLKDLDSSLLPQGYAKEVIDLAITAGNLVSESNPSKDYLDEVEKFQTKKLNPLKAKISVDSEWLNAFERIEEKVNAYYWDKKRSFPSDEIFHLEM